MIATLHDAASSRQLAASVVAGARAGVTTGLGDPHVLGVGGSWQQATWREQLRRAGGQGRPLVTVGLRSVATDRVLPDGDWTAITRRLAEHSGLAGSPWVAVRTGLRTAVLLARTDQRPDPATLRVFTAEIERGYHLTRPGGPAQAFPPLAPTAAGPSDASPAPALPPSRHAGRGR